jgi:hypothetical protein
VKKKRSQYDTATPEIMLMMGQAIGIDGIDSWLRFSGATLSESKRVYKQLSKTHPKATPKEAPR